MITIETEFEELYFTCGIPDMVISTDGESVGITVAVTPIGGDASTIYGETVYAVGGKVVLSALSSLLRPYVEKSLLASVAIAVYAVLGEGRPVTSSFTVRHSTVDVLSPAADFLNSHFLTLARGRRVTSPHRTEALHYVGDDSAVVVATYDNLQTRTFQMETEADADTGIQSVDVSPSQFEDESVGRLVAYDVVAGARQQRFVVVAETRSAMPCVTFRNAFGVYEFVYCTGNFADNAEYTHQQLVVNDSRVTYGVDEKTEYSADSGTIPEGSVELWKDMLRSAESYLADNRQQPRHIRLMRIVITEAKPSYTNDDAEMARFSFKFMPSGKHTVCDYRPHGRIFDNSFDSTFN